MTSATVTDTGFSYSDTARRPYDSARPYIDRQRPRSKRLTSAAAVMTGFSIIAAPGVSLAGRIQQFETTTVAGSAAPVIDNAAVQAVPALQILIDRIFSLSEKADGWKGPDSKAMSENVRKAATDFITAYFDDGNLAIPFIGLDADGEIAMFWKTPSIIMDLTISGDGTYSYYAEVGGVEYAEDEMKATAPLRAELKQSLRAQA